MLAKSLVDVRQADLEALLANKVIELTTLEYKRDMPATDDERREIVYDIASLANTRGGDLIFGIDAERDSNNKPTGAPKEIVGIGNQNLDDLKLRLLQAIQNTTKPQIEGVEFASVGSFKNGPALIVRVPASWNGPHLMQLEKAQRFYARTSAGRYIMDVDQIRAAMIASASLPDRLDTLRRERVSKIASNQGASPLTPSAKLLFHLVPFASLARTVRIDPSDLAKLPTGTISMAGGGDPRINYDGYLLPTISKGGQPVGYVQAYRTGVIESVVARLTDGASPPLIAAGWFEKVLVDAIRSALKGMKTIGLPAPYYVAITMLGVKGACIATSYYERVGPIDRDVLFLPEIQVDRVDLSEQEAAAVLRPAFDVAWQSAGAARSFNFDETGRWDHR
jgi:hypothetical protein